MENYFQAKKRFFDEIIPAGEKHQKYRMIVNGDDLWGQRLLNELGTKLPSLTFGIENRCDMTAERYEFSIDGIRADINTGESCFPVASLLIGKFNLYNILAAAAASVSLNIPEKFIQTGIRNLKNVPGRLDKVNIPGEPAIFVDYAHTDDALRRVLQNLSTFKKRKIITVFGCGGDRDRGKRPLMGNADTTLSDLTIVTSDNPRTEDPLFIIEEIEKGIEKNSVKKFLPAELGKNLHEKGYVIIPDRRKAIETAVALADMPDIILIAGKGHENYQIIGAKQIPFDDRHVAREAIMNKRHGEKQ
jgi:UDP-N-acetylmuramoyl-L-alanyl-D-glutamate--2,6-diaminopimelate ligase